MIMRITVRISTVLKSALISCLGEHGLSSLARCGWEGVDINCCVPRISIDNQIQSIKNTMLPLLRT